MALFKKKDPDYIDLEKHMSKHENKIKNMKSYKLSEDGTVDLSGQLSQAPTQESQVSSSESSGGGFFGGFFSGGNSQSSAPEISESEEKKKKLIKRIIDLTNKVEEQDKEIYRMKQRLELLERKSRIDY